METQKFGRYEIKAELGRGGMATVYHAYDPRFEREVALKVLPREMLHDPQFRTRFDREAKTIAMLEHPAIVPVYDFGEEDGQPYFVMRYMAGGSLADRMKSGPLSIQEIARLMARLAPALDGAHAKGIIHRDLKPGNILFDAYNEPYISDFGIAKLAEAQGSVTGSAIVGTPAYMSPEQAQGVKVDGRSDIYGLGVILFELLSGRQPYEGATPMSVVVKHITDPIPHILDVKPDLPAPIEQIVEKAMAKDPDQRFSTVQALANSLEAVARGETPDIEAIDQTLSGSAKTVAVKKGEQPAAKTVLSQGTGTSAKTALAQRGATPAAGLPQAPVRKKGGAWIAVVIVLFLLIAAGVGGVVVFRDKIPFLAAAPTQTIQATRPPVRDTPVVPVAASKTPPAADSPVPSNTPQPTLTATATTPPSVVIGGADMVAFLNANDIWVMLPDGSKLEQLTTDGAEKHSLQWAPDGKSIYYISGLCINSVTLEKAVNTLTCLNSMNKVQDFEISPSGDQVAITVDEGLFLVPFDPAGLAKARSWAGLQALKGCIDYGLLPNQAPPKSMRWSTDQKMIAINTLSVDNGSRVDMIRLYDISKCDRTLLTGVLEKDQFPSWHFQVSGSTLPSYDWDGEAVFVLNNSTFGEFGSLYTYNNNPQDMSHKQVDPIGTNCCYTGLRWSPDRNYLAFFYQDVHGAGTSAIFLYYVPFGTIGTGAKYTPISLPEGFFKNPKSHIEVILRPAKP